MPLSRKIAIGALMLSFVPAILGAYEPHLSSTAIRDAYFLGRDNNNRTAEFLAQYVHQFPAPKTGPQIAEIEVVTPYAQVVRRAREESVGYTAQQAEQNFHDRPAKFYVWVRINLTASYPAVIPERVGSTEGFKLRPPDFWRDFAFHVSQEGREIPSRSVNGSPTYLPDDLLRGAQVRLQFDAAQIKSDSLLIEVVSPDGSRLASEFELPKLK